MDHLLALPQGTELVGDFSLKRVLGAGGFGITYLARDLQLDRSVAIKEYFPSEFAAREGAAMVRCRSQSSEPDYRTGLERFVDEAQALARFEHPNIVRVFRYFRANNTAYMVLQFEAGRSLKGWLDDLGRRPFQAELDGILLPLLDALELLHANDFLHRDIAPDNILIRPDGSPVLIDFGSARGDLAERSRTVSAIVKPGYSPFEQYSSRGQRQGPWTDIYALAATLYHAITGERPLDAPSRMSGSEIRPARAVGHGDYRPGFLAAIDQALMVRAESRPQTIASWRRMLFGPTEPPRVYVGTPQQVRSPAQVPNPMPVPARTPAQTPVHTTHLHAHAPTPGSPTASPQMTGASPAQVAARPLASQMSAAPTRAAAAGPMPPQQTRKIETGAAPPLVWQRHERPPEMLNTQADFPDRAARPLDGEADPARAGAARDVPRSRSRPPRTQPAVAAGLGLAGRLARALADKLQGAASAFDKPTHRPAGSPAPQAAPGVLASPGAQPAPPGGSPFPGGQPAAGATTPSSRFDEELQESVARVEAEIEAARLSAAKAVEARAAAAAREAERLASKEQAAARRAERRLQRQVRWTEFETRLGASVHAGLRTGLRLALFAGIVFFAIKLPGLISQPNAIPTAAVGISLDTAPSDVGLARTLRGHEAPILALAFEPDERRLVSIDSRQAMLVWDLEGSAPPERVRLEGESFTAIDTDARHLLVGRATGALDVLDRRSGAMRAIRGGDGGAITALNLLRDGRRESAVAATADGSLRLYDLGRGRYRTLRDAGSPVTAMATAAAADELVMGGQDAAVRLYSVRRNRVLQTFHAHADAVSTVAWARSAGLIASGSRDRSIKVWDPTSPASLKTLSGHEGTITALVFTPDARHLVSASADHTVRLWEIATGRLVHTFIGHTAAVRAIALIGGGAWLSSAGDDETIRIWGLPRQAAGSS